MVAAEIGVCSDSTFVQGTAELSKIASACNDQWTPRFPAATPFCALLTVFYP